MQRNFVSPFVLLTACYICISSCASWSYDETGEDGPSKWWKSYPPCKGQRQTPIDIKVSQTVHSVDLDEFAFSPAYFENPSGNQYTILNNGHTIQVNVNTTNMVISRGGLPSKYQLVQLHMHWGSDNSKGSEHTLDETAYPLEIHLVHYDEVKYKSISAALKGGTGVAVLGIFVTVGDRENKAFRSITDHLRYVKYSGQNYTGLTFDVSDLLPRNVDNYFRYLGSLTTPSCDESVVWTMFQKPVTVTFDQLAMIRGVMHSKPGEHEHHLVNNYRPLQKLNNRVIKRSFCTCSSSSIFVKPVTLLLLAALAHISF